MRSENVIKNSIWTTINTVITIAIGFISRTIFIYILNSEYLGIDGLFSNILSLLSLSELGFGSAVTFNLYKPLREKDEKKIAAIMNFYKWIYRMVAVFIFVVGMCLVPFLRYIIKDTTFDIKYITGIYVLFLIKTAITYLYSYNFTLATADQRGYIIGHITMINNIVTPIAKIVALAITRSFVAYIVAEIVLTLGFNLIKTLHVKKAYPVLEDTKSSLEKQETRKILKDVQNIFLGKVSTTVLTSTDNLIISSFVNVISVGFMSNYNTLVNYISTFISGALYSAQASIGNAIASEGKEYVYNILKKLTLITLFVASFATTALFCLSSDFISIVWSKNEDMTLPVVTVFIVMFNAFFQFIKSPLWITLTSAGLFEKDKYISFIGMVMNIVVSLILVQYLGLVGVILGTIISQSVQMILKAKLLFNEYFFMGSGKYLLLILECFTLFVAEELLTYFICINIPVSNIYLLFVCKMFMCVLVPNLMNYAIFHKTEEYEYFLKLILKVTKIVHRKRRFY